MSDNAAHSLIRGLIPAIVAISFLIFRKYLPNNSRGNTSEDDRAASDANRYVNVAIVVAGVLIAVSSFFLLREANKLSARLDGPALHTVLPGSFLWWFFPLFGGITLAPEAVLRIWSLIGHRHDAKAFERWSDAKANFRVYTVIRWMIVILTIPIGIFSLLSIPRHANFLDTEISIGRFAHLRPEHHPYDTIRRFRMIDGFFDRDGIFHLQPTILLDFSDGKQWNSWVLTEDKTFDYDLIYFLQAKLHREPEHTLTEKPQSRQQ